MFMGLKTLPFLRAHGLDNVKVADAQLERKLLAAA